MNRNMKPPIPSEYLSKEILEEEFIKVFSIYHGIQKILGACRVDVRDRFITAPSIPQKIYTIICIAFTISVSCFGFHVYADILNTRLYYLVFSGGILILLCSLCNTVHVRFLNKDANVAFYVKMQEIDRIMDIHLCKPLNRKLFRMHMFTIVTMIGVAVLLLIITLITRKVLVLGFLTLALTYGNFLLEMAYCSNLIAYFYLRVRFINAIMNNYIEAQSRMIYATPNLSIKFFASQSHNFLTSDTDIHLKRIIECFFEYQDLYRFQVLVFFIGFILSWGLCAQIVIEGIQANIIGLVELIAVSTICLITYFMLIFLCLRLQVLYMATIQTKRLSLHVMSMYVDGPIREKAKKMYKLIQENGKRFSVYDMWYMDASVIFSVLGLMTTILVTVLQFAYL